MASPADLRLRSDSINQPDVFVTDLVPTGEQVESFDELPTWDDVKRLLLAVEVISPSSIRTDRIRKRDFYMGSPVDEYWVVDSRRVSSNDGPRITKCPKSSTTLLEVEAAGSKAPFVIDVKTMFAKIWKGYQSSGLR